MAGGSRLRHYPGMSSPQRASVGQQARLLASVWVTALRVVVALRRQPLHSVATASPGTGHDRVPLALLSRAVTRGLRIGPWQPRCLVRALVLYRLLRAQGDPAELVIGLHHRAASPDAHAWVLLDGRDVGPPPGGAGYEEMTRFPRPA